MFGGGARGCAGGAEVRRECTYAFRKTERMNPVPTGRTVREAGPYGENLAFGIELEDVWKGEINLHFIGRFMRR